MTRKRRQRKKRRTGPDSRGRTQNENRRRKTVINHIGIPDELHCRLRYIETFQDVAGAFEEYLYRGNGPYDPNQAVGGGQPQYWDELTAMYGSYCSVRSRMRLEVLQQAGSTAASFISVGVYPNINTTAAITLTQAQMQDRSKHRNLGPNTGNRGVVEFTYESSIMQMYGVTLQNAYDSADFQSATSTTPVDEWFYHIYIGTYDSATNVNVRVNVVIDYDIKFYDRLVSDPSIFYLDIGEDSEPEYKKVLHEEGEEVRGGQSLTCTNCHCISSTMRITGQFAEFDHDPGEDLK
jgi:hypothetical protein